MHSIFKSPPVTRLLVIAAACCLPWQFAAAELLQDAWLVDGSGAPGQRGSVRIDRGVIVDMGDLQARPGETVIHGSGLVLAPGFIDTHSHQDGAFGRSSSAIGAVSQGITSVILGNYGGSPYAMAELRELIENTPLTINVASYTGHGTLRQATMGKDYQRAANDAELAAMSAQLRDELAQGSLGLSTGLEYDPGIYATREELVQLAKVSAAAGGRYISHMRSEDRYFDRALEELLYIGREAQISVQISHIKLALVDRWGEAGSVIAKLNRARAEGIDVSADIYPYTYWLSTLAVLLPERDFHDLEAARFALEKLAPADGLTLAHYDPNPAYVGKTVADIAAALDQTDEDTYLQLIRDAYPAGYASYEEARESVIGVSMREDDIADFIRWPHTNICSDGGDEPGGGHPRDYGAFPKALREYVVEQELLSLEQMLHKMTRLSAAHVGLKGRGLLVPGHAADLVLIDMNRITDRASIENPKAVSEGIVGVWVNGERIWQDGQVTERRPGQLLRRAD